MSFKIVDQAQPRLNRSELAVPGSNPSLFEKAAKSNVDVIFLDLEDAVAPDEKEQARKNIIEALNKFEGCKVIDDRSDGGYITPLEAEGKNETFISRIREDKTIKNGLNLWIVSDNLLRGAALNAVEIAETLINNNFYGK